MMLPSRHYVSEHTQFMRKLMEKHPELKKDQQEARARWWDKTPRALAQEHEMDEGRVVQSSYVYQSAEPALPADPHG